MVCNCTLSRTKACEHCIYGNPNVGSQTIQYLDLRDIVDKAYATGWNEAMKYIEEQAKDKQY